MSNRFIKRKAPKPAQSLAELDRLMVQVRQEFTQRLTALVPVFERILRNTETLMTPADAAEAAALMEVFKAGIGGTVEALERFTGQVESATRAIEQGKETLNAVLAAARGARGQ